MPFSGQRVLSLESRRSTETAELIRRNGGDPFVAPSMREVPIAENQAAFDFAERLIREEFDLVILLNGVGTRFLMRVLESRYPREQIIEALGKIPIAARGPKPVAALRELGLSPAVVAPEPNTWRELLEALKGRPERRIAIQEYGRPNPELVEGLRAWGAEVTSVPVYQWALPEDRGPLEEAIRQLAGGKIDWALFTTSQQVVHLFQVAQELGVVTDLRRGLEKAKIASIGPTTTEMLSEFNLKPTVEASHPKLGILVKEAADQA